MHGQRKLASPGRADEAKYHTLHEGRYPDVPIPRSHSQMVQSGRTDEVKMHSARKSTTLHKVGRRGQWRRSSRGTHHRAYRAHVDLTVLRSRPGARRAVIRSGWHCLLYTRVRQAARCSEPCAYFFVHGSQLRNPCGVLPCFVSQRQPQHQSAQLLRACLTTPKNCGHPRLTKKRVPVPHSTPSRTLLKLLQPRRWPRRTVAQ